MDRLCKFSTSILAGNVATLLLVAMATDYWQHRSFDLSGLGERLATAREALAVARGRLDGRSDDTSEDLDDVANRTDLTSPRDTGSYAVLGCRLAGFRGYSSYARQTIHLESPALMARAWRVDAASVEVEAFDVAYLFSEYGSLLRDCKQLESLSIERLPLPVENKVRCEWFLFGREAGHFISVHLPAVYYLELLAAAFGLATLVCTLTSLLFGVRGNLGHDSVSLTRASALAVATSVCCTLTIALFHTKLNLRRRRPLFDDQPATMELLAWIRPAEQVSYGWSFYLAWVCVLLSMAEAAMWLHQMDRRERDAEWERSRDLVDRIRSYYRSRNYAHGVYDD